MGCAAAAWNTWYEQAYYPNSTAGAFSKRATSSGGGTVTDKSFLDLVTGLFEKAFGYNGKQIASPSVPDPFASGNISFVDGSEAKQSIPFIPLIQPDRRVDLM